MNRLKTDPAILARVRALLAQRDARPLPTGHTRPEAKVNVLADGGAEVLLYDEIGYWGVTAADMAAALSPISGPLHLRVNSPGGDVFDGIAIYNMLADYPGEVTVTVDGLAASAASFIAMAGDRITMNRGSKLMIHDASGLCIGNAAEMTAMAALLDMVSGTIADVYAARAGGDAEAWRSLMRDETWYTAQAAVDAGLADEMVPHPSREDDEDSADEQRYADVAASLFPYGRLAALFASEAATSQASAPETPRVPAAVPQPPAEPTPEPAPATPAVEDVEDEPNGGDTPDVEPGHDPHPWAEATAHLLNPPISEDEWESLREALL
jgi:ATP-dependent protease ClpP protease subunit